MKPSTVAAAWPAAPLVRLELAADFDAVAFDIAGAKDSAEVGSRARRGQVDSTGALDQGGGVGGRAVGERSAAPKVDPESRLQPDDGPEVADRPRRARDLHAVGGLDQRRPIGPAAVEESAARLQPRAISRAPVDRAEVADGARERKVDSGDALDPRGGLGGRPVDDVAAGFEQHALAGRSVDQAFIDHLSRTLLDDAADAIDQGRRVRTAGVEDLGPDGHHPAPSTPVMVA